MNFNDYIKECRRTGDFNLDESSICLCAMGISGEAGEITDYLKKIVFHSHSFDKSKLTEEVGDLMWYIAQLIYICEIDFNEVLKTNVKKLRKRYPNGFSAKDSIERK